MIKLALVGVLYSCSVFATEGHPEPRKVMQLKMQMQLSIDDQGVAKHYAADVHFYKDGRPKGMMDVVSYNAEANDAVSVVSAVKMKMVKDLKENYHPLVLSKTYHQLEVFRAECIDTESYCTLYAGRKGQGGIYLGRTSVESNPRYVAFLAYEGQIELDNQRKERANEEED